jgi:hypothetical protein
MSCELISKIDGNRRERGRKNRKNKKTEAGSTANTTLHFSHKLVTHSVGITDRN